MAEPIDAAELAFELTERGVPLDVQLDAIGAQLESNPDAAAIVSGWMLRMMNAAAPVPDATGSSIARAADG